MLKIFRPQFIILYCSLLFFIILYKKLFRGVKNNSCKLREFSWKIYQIKSTFNNPPFSNRPVWNVHRAVWFAHKSQLHRRSRHAERQIAVLFYRCNRQWRAAWNWRNWNFRLCVIFAFSFIQVQKTEFAGENDLSWIYKSRISYFCVIIVLFIRVEYTQ